MSIHIDMFTRETLDVMELNCFIIKLDFLKQGLSI